MTFASLMGQSRSFIVAIAICSSQRRPTVEPSTTQGAKTVNEHAGLDTKEVVGATARLHHGCIIS